MGPIKNSYNRGVAIIKKMFAMCSIEIQSLEKLKEYIVDNVGVQHSGQSLDSLTFKIYKKIPKTHYISFSV